MFFPANTNAPLDLHVFEARGKDIGGELVPFVTSKTAVCFSIHFLKSKMDRSNGFSHFWGS